MKEWLLSFLLSVLIFSNQAIAQSRHPEVPRMSAEMAYYKYKTGKVILVDAMDQRTFAKKHILGSISLPNDGARDIERIRNMEIPFPKDTEFIVYCE